MKLLQIALVSVLILATTLPVAHAQEVKPINLALFDPIQLFDNETAIHGLRLSIYGQNAALKGLDVGIANCITGDVTGLQYGVVNFVEGDFTGWQDGAVLITEGFMKGLQSGIVSINGSGKGLMWSGVNASDDFIGLQVGLVNYAVSFHGLQIGLINIIKEGGMLPVFPFFNFSSN